MTLLWEYGNWDEYVLIIETAMRMGSVLQLMLTICVDSETIWKSDNCCDTDWPLQELLLQLVGTGISL